MSQQGQGTNSSPIDLPMKRKRGRPRKYQNLVQGENMMAIAMPGLDSARKNKVSPDTSEKMDGDMVGQVVSGVIDGSFDAGYLLNVKVGNTDTHLRGVVFLPGRFIPVTPANDIAPHVSMLQRKEIPVPTCNNLQTPPPGSTSQSKRSTRPPLELEIQSAVPMAVDIQTGSVTVLQADDTAKNNTGPSLEGIFVPKQTSESGLEIPPSVTEQPVETMNQGIFPDRAPPFEIHCAAPMELDKQPASAILSLAVNSSNNDMGSSLERNSLPQQTSEPEFGISSTIQDNTQVIGININAKVLPEQASFTGLQLGTHARPSSDVVPISGNSAEIVIDSSWRGKHVLQQTSESGHEIRQLYQDNKQQSIQQVTPFDLQSAFPTALGVPFAELLKNDKGPSLSGLGDQSVPFMAQMKFDKVVEQKELLGDFKLNALVSEEVKKPNIELTGEGPGTGNDLVLRIGCEAEGSQNHR